jgi:hypothetical protein
VSASITADEVFLAAFTILYFRVFADSVTIVATTSCVALECCNPSFALRDLLAERQTEFSTGSTYGRRPLDYTVVATEASEHPRRQTGRPAIDNAPVKDGWFVLETGNVREYHPWNSLQIVAVTRAQRLIIGFASIVYEATFPTGTDLKSQFRQITGATKRGHCTIHPADAYLNWLPSARVYCERIREIPGLPDLTSLQEVKDFGAAPEHAEFKSKVPPKPPARGVDIE